MRKYFICCAFLSLIGPCTVMAQANADVEMTSQIGTDQLPSSLLQISETDTFSKYAFLVDKAKRILAVFERDGENIKKILEFPADIGKNDGPKMRRNDHKTPEGIYVLGEKLSQPEIPFDLYGNLAFTTNYPNYFDKLEEKTGSGIWLHAVPDSTPLTRGSRGCVVVRNSVIKKLADYVKLKETPILIFDKVEYISKKEHEIARKKMTQFIEGWRNAWEQQDMDTYMSYYSENFRAPGFNKNSWKAHKSRLKGRYDYVKIGFSQPYIVQHNDQLLIKTLQRYESDKHVDFGVKTVYALKDGSTFKIVREEWEPYNPNVVTKAIVQNNTNSTN